MLLIAVLPLAIGAFYAYLQSKNSSVPTALTPATTTPPVTTTTPTATQTQNSPGQNQTGRAPAGLSALQHQTTVLINADGPAQPLTGAAALAILNHQRTVNGIPPIRILRQSYASAWCPNEDHGSRGGEIDRDLSSIPLWGTTLTPWDNAPAHQLSMFDPLFTAAGAVDANGQACFGAGALARAPRRLTFYAYTSDNGRTLVPPTEVVREAPFAPQQYVGVPEGVATGPQLLLYAEGFPEERFNALGRASAVHVLSWSLTDLATGQRVRNVHFFDSRVAAHTVFPYAYNDSGVMIPPPLQEATRYLARITWEGPTSIRATQSVTFTTAHEPKLKLFNSGERIGATVSSSVLASGASTTMSLTAGQFYTFCFYQSQGSGYTAAAACSKLSYTIRYDGIANSGPMPIGMTVSVN